MSRLVALWNHFDPKLKYTVVTFAVARIIAALAVPLDPALESIICGVIASFVGYHAENDGTLLREGTLDDGNPKLPKSLQDVKGKKPK